MRDPIYDPKASKQTVSVTLNSDLYRNAKSLGINVSKVAEQAIADEYAARRKEALLAELRKDLAAVENYEEQHGSFPELVRVHYEREDGAV
ncbi:MAG TPA: type II toxin-antitoxin system CcdA family antitoxin [Steroidobacteraceae bacterium]|jgi:post-segregation antitoxin (ccd killing protein)|nr:type II toxin-antitoxin system CcdA family antitoxin [Steroidobacteraceae bacterium]